MFAKVLITNETYKYLLYVLLYFCWLVNEATKFLFSRL